ncbi:hypothetical protein FB451DRAFT_1181496 [Mycena latifolia]|nr:hypothetical protein FB451DRAFT_1181496 [Mycena latifolia]
MRLGPVGPLGYESSQSQIQLTWVTQGSWRGKARTLSARLEGDDKLVELLSDSTNFALSYCLIGMLGIFRHPALVGSGTYMSLQCVLFLKSARNTTTWDYRLRDFLVERETTRLQQRDAAVREWTSIPHANLPSPWSCDWACWPHWEKPDPLEAVYALSDQPLAPVMFNAFDDSTVFACAVTHCVPKTRRDLPVGTMYAFDGIFSSVDSFIEEADWNRVELIRAVAEGAADSHPSQKRTLWEAKMPRASEWARIPEAQLPEPWSCDWPKFVNCHDWYDGDGGQEEVRSAYGPALAGLVPALFVPLGPFRGDTVLCRPGGAGTYYLWWNQHRSDSGLVWKGAMQRFEGEYASLKHFVRTADWNRLQRVVPYTEAAYFGL